MGKQQGKKQIKEEIRSGKGKNWEGKEGRNRRHIATNRHSADKTGTVAGESCSSPASSIGADEMLPRFRATRLAHCAPSRTAHNLTHELLLPTSTKQKTPPRPASLPPPRPASHAPLLPLRTAAPPPARRQLTSVRHCLLPPRGRPSSPVRCWKTTGGRLLRHRRPHQRHRPATAHCRPGFRARPSLLRASRGTPPQTPPAAAPTAELQQPASPLQPLTRRCIPGRSAPPASNASHPHVRCSPTFFIRVPAEAQPKKLQVIPLLLLDSYSVLDIDYGNLEESCESKNLTLHCSFFVLQKFESPGC